MRASVDVAVVLKRAGVLEELAALVAVVPAGGNNDYVSRLLNMNRRLRHQPQKVKPKI